MAFCGSGVLPKFLIGLQSSLIDDFELFIDFVMCMLPSFRIGSIEYLAEATRPNNLKEDYICGFSELPSVLFC